jgi:hypothetical protein
MNHRVPWNAGNVTSWATVSFWTRTLLHLVSSQVVGNRAPPVQPKASYRTLILMIRFMSSYRLHVLRRYFSPSVRHHFETWQFRKMVSCGLTSGIKIPEGALRPRPLSNFSPPIRDHFETWHFRKMVSYGLTYGVHIPEGPLGPPLSNFSPQIRDHFETWQFRKIVSYGLTSGVQIPEGALRPPSQTLCIGVPVAV